MRRVLPRRLAVLCFVFLTVTAEWCSILDVEEPRAGMEGTWTLTEIYGAPVPAGGYSLELAGVPTGYKLVSGTLAFSSPSSGSVVAGYRIEKEGVLGPEDFYSGTFTYDGSNPGTVTMRSAKDQLEGSVTFGAAVSGVTEPPGELTISQIIFVKDPLTKTKVPVPVKVTLRRGG